MRKLGITLVDLGLFGAAGQVRAADVLKKLSTNATTNGKFTSSGKTEVTIEKTTGATDTVPVNDIDWLSFDGEPTSLKSIRTNAANGSYAAALTNLAKIDPDGASRPEVKQSVMYLRASATPSRAWIPATTKKCGLPARKCWPSSRKVPRTTIPFGLRDSGRLAGRARQARASRNLL